MTAGDSMVRRACGNPLAAGVGAARGMWTDKEDMEEANDSRLVMDNNDDVKAIEAMGKHRILGRPLDLFILAASGGLVGYLLYALSPSSLPPYLV